MNKTKLIGFLLTGLANLTPIQATLNVTIEDAAPPNLRLQNASDTSSTRIVFVTDDNNQKFLFTGLNIEDGQIKAKINDGSDKTYTLFGHGLLSEKTFGDDPAQILMAAQPYNDTETTWVPMGGWLGKQGGKKPETRTITKYNAWTMLGTLIQEEDGLKYFFPNDWLPNTLSTGNDTHKIDFGLGGLDWAPLVNVGQPGHWDFSEQPCGDKLYGVLFGVNNALRQAGGAAPLTYEGSNFQSFWCSENPDLRPLFQDEPFLTVNSLAD